MTHTTESIANAEKIAAGLTDAQRETITRLSPYEGLMGGYGADSGCPSLVERYGINHPVFGSHYRLTTLGLAVREILRRQS